MTTKELIYDMLWYKKNNSKTRKLEFMSVYFGLIGAVLIAYKIKWGFVLFLVSSIIGMCWSLIKGYKHMTIQYMAFTVTNLLGIYHWFFGE